MRRRPSCGSMGSHGIERDRMRYREVSNNIRLRAWRSNKRSKLLIAGFEPASLKPHDSSLCKTSTNTNPSQAKASVDLEDLTIGPDQPMDAFSNCYMKSSIGRGRQPKLDIHVKAARRALEEDRSCYQWLLRTYVKPRSMPVSLSHTVRKDIS